MPNDWLVVGIAGTTCSGKTSLSGALKDRYSDSTVITLDDFFFDVKSERHVRVPEVDHINFDILSSLDVDSFLEQVYSVLSDPVVKRPSLLILDGFLLLNEPRIVELCDVKLFLEVDKSTCFARRNVRIYDPPDTPGYFEVCVWPSYLEHLRIVKETVRDVHYLDGTLSLNVIAEKAIAILEVEINNF